MLSVALDYVEGRTSLDDVQEWVVPRLGELLADPRSTPSELAALFELGAADVAAGELQEDELRELVADFIRAHQPVRINLGSVVVTATTNVIAEMGLVTAGPTAVNRLEPLTAGR